MYRKTIIGVMVVAALAAFSPKTYALQYTVDWPTPPNHEANQQHPREIKQYWVQYQVKNPPVSTANAPKPSTTTRGGARPVPGNVPFVDPPLPPLEWRNYRFCQTREQAERLVKFLQSKGYTARTEHAATTTYYWTYPSGHYKNGQWMPARTTYYGALPNGMGSDTDTSK